MRAVHILFFASTILLSWTSGGLGQPNQRRSSQLEGQTEAYDVLQGRQLLGPTRLVCDVSLCNDPERRSVLLDLIAWDSSTFDAAAFAEAWSRLKRTGLFSQVELRVESIDGRSFAPAQAPPTMNLQPVFHCQGHVVITELEVVYADWRSWIYPKQFVAEIRKRLPLRRGGTFPARGADGDYRARDKLLLEEYEQRVRSLYREQGFIGTDVEIRAEGLGATGKEVRVEVWVKEGEQPPLGEVLVRGAKAFPYWKIVGPLSTGERLDFWRDTFGVFGVGRYARREIKEDLATVEARYREEGYVTARVRLEPEPLNVDGKVYPKVRILEGPRLTVRFRGNRSLSDGQLEQVLTFKENGAFDETEMEDSKKAIVSIYQSTARYFVQVDAKRKVKTNGEFEVTFDINEGPRVYVKRIELVGAHTLDEAEILSVMETQGVAGDGVINTLNSSPGVLQNGRITNDLMAIRKLYASQGMPQIKFRCAPPNVVPQVWTTLRNLEPQKRGMYGPKGHRSLIRGLIDSWSNNPIKNHCFMAIPDEDPRLVVLRIQLDEGLRSTVDHLSAKDTIEKQMDEAMQDEAYALLEELGFVDELRRWKKGVGLTSRKLEAVRRFLLRYYHQEGYLSATVTTDCSQPDEQIAAGSTGRSDGASCDEGYLYGIHLDTVDFRVVRGPKTKVNGILLRGNLNTRNRILLDELVLKEGQPLGSDELFLSQTNLRSLGIFDSVNVDYISSDSSWDDLQISAQPNSTAVLPDRKATVLVTVEESNPRLLDLYLGLQLDSTPLESELPVLYSLGTSIRDRNLGGYALEVGVGLNHSNRIAAPGDIRGDDAFWQAGPFMKNRRFLGTKLDMAAEALLQRGLTGQRDAYEEVLTATMTIGYDFYNLSFPSKWGKGLRSALTNSFRRERRRGLTVDGIRPPFGRPTDSITTQPSSTWDTRDSPLHPTRGSLVIVSAEAIFLSLTEIDDLPIKTSMNAQYVHSFFKRQLIVVPNLRLGAVWTDLAEDRLTSGFLFKAGGDGVSIPVRGYADAAIEACNGDKERSGDYCNGVYPNGVSARDDFAVPATIGGQAMMAGGLELRFPTHLLNDFWGSLFSDFGAVAPHWSDLRGNDFHASVGAGLRYLVTGQIPLRMDLAYPLTETVFSPQSLRVHLNIFYTL